MPNPTWIRCFNAKELHRALTELDPDSYHPPGPKTVDRWRRDQSRMEPQDIAAVHRLVGATKDPLPEWAGGLTEEVRAIRTLLLEPAEGTALAQLERLLRQLGAETGPDPTAGGRDR